MSGHGVREWERIACVADDSCGLPAVRSGHTAIEICNTLYIFGGYHTVGQPTCLGDLWKLDLVTFRWRRVNVPWEPDARASHCWCVCSGQGADTSAAAARIFVMGGSGPQWGQSNRDGLVEFNCKHEEWRRVRVRGDAPDDMPAASYGQAMVTFQNRLYLFGGTTGHAYSNSLFELELPPPDATAYEDTPGCESAADDGGGGRHGLQAAETIPPGGAAFADTKHGSSEEGREIAVWRHVHAGGDVPSPRYRHQAVVVGAYMYVVGGGQFEAPEGDIDVHRLRLDVDDKRWERLHTAGDAPCARIAHSVALLGRPQDGPTVRTPRVAQGAGSRTGSCFESYLPVRAQQAEVQGTPQPGEQREGARGPRRDHVQAQVQNADGVAQLRGLHLLVYGGRAHGHVLLADLHALNLHTLQWHCLLAGDSAGETGDDALGTSDPGSREFHTLVVRGDTMLTFGGSDGERRFDDVHRFHVRLTPPPLMLLCLKALKRVVDAVEAEARAEQRTRSSIGEMLWSIFAARPRNSALEHAAEQTADAETAESVALPEGTAMSSIDLPDDVRSAIATLHEATLDAEMHLC